MPTEAPVAPARPPARRGGAKSQLLTVLGEFVLPAGGTVWTASLVEACRSLGIGEKNARQAIARTGEQGLIAAERHGRSVRWTLTSDGFDLLETGTRRIYEFGSASDEWNGEWLVAHCPVAESRRTLRHQLRTRLGFLGFGELSASLLVSPHVDRELPLLAVLDEFGLGEDSSVMRSTMLGDDADVVRRAWDLGSLSSSYHAFLDTHGRRSVVGDAAAFAAVVELVHDWRRYPFDDPELPNELLPDDWAGRRASAVFHDRHDEWAPAARRWFADLEARAG